MAQAPLRRGQIKRSWRPVAALLGLAVLVLWGDLSPEASSDEPKRPTRGLKAIRASAPSSARRNPKAVARPIAKSPRRHLKGSEIRKLAESIGLLTGANVYESEPIWLDPAHPSKEQPLGLSGFLAAHQAYDWAPAWWQSFGGMYKLNTTPFIYLLRHQTGGNTFVPVVDVEYRGAKGKSSVVTLDLEALGSATLVLFQGGAQVGTVTLSNGPWDLPVFLPAIQDEWCRLGLLVQDGACYFYGCEIRVE